MGGDLKFILFLIHIFECFISILFQDVKSIRIDKILLYLVPSFLHQLTFFYFISHYVCECVCIVFVPNNMIVSFTHSGLYYLVLQFPKSNSFT